MSQFPLGLEYRHTFTVTDAKTVPALYPEAEEFLAMPRVFATGFLVGLLEWACILAVNPYLDWPRQQTVGIRIDITHEAPTPVGMSVAASVRLAQVNGRRLVFDVSAADEWDTIARGVHERAVIDHQRFSRRVAAKALPADP
ncbi:MAG: thioesterase family protein [Egibacteraceae bacterium]